MLSAECDMNVHKNTPNHKMLCEGTLCQCVVHICVIVSVD